MKLIPLGVSGAYPVDDLGTSSYFVRGDKNLLFDVGTGAMNSLDRIMSDFDELDCIFITHFHPDHIAELFLLSHRLSKEKRLPIYYFDDKSDYINLIELEEKFEGRKIQVGDFISCGEMSVEVVVAFHPILAVGFKISENGRRLYYTGDTYLAEEIAKSAEGVDVVLADSMRLEKNANDKFHMSAKEALELSKKVSARLLATHIFPKERERVVEYLGEEQIAIPLKEYTI